ncbi:MAG: hypothetical protein KJZ86_00175 [Caldilineaceae bacterium]|mgnify:CR=1 FL=1|nr:hypothetical protein [Caldilineaceae bacterium]HRJ40723.1 hypothetical protein [Caldilineaceae bacterium]
MRISMPAHIHKDDLLLTNFQFECDAVLNVDGNRMKPGESALQRWVRPL